MCPMNRRRRTRLFSVQVHVHIHVHAHVRIRVLNRNPSKDQGGWSLQGESGVLHQLSGMCDWFSLFLFSLWIFNHSDLLIRSSVHRDTYMKGSKEISSPLGTKSIIYNGMALSLLCEHGVMCTSICIGSCLLSFPENDFFFFWPHLHSQLALSR